MESCNTIVMMFPLFLYLIKDNIDMSELSHNKYLNLSLLVVGFLLNKDNFQGTVYIMFVYFMIQSLAKDGGQELSEELEDVDEVQEGFSAEETVNFEEDFKRETSEKSNLYAFDPFSDKESKIYENLENVNGYNMDEGSNYELF